MSDWEDFEDDCHERRDSGLVCGMRKYLDNLGRTSIEAREAVERALRRPELRATAIRAALLKRGPGAPSAWTIRTHRRGDCGCAAEEE